MLIKIHLSLSYVDWCPIPILNIIEYKMTISLKSLYYNINKSYICFYCYNIKSLKFGNMHNIETNINHLCTISIDSKREDK